MIPVWLRGGASKEDVAEALGTSVGSLEAVCSNRSISLSRKAYNDTGAPAPDLNAALRKQLQGDAWAKLCVVARSRRMSGGRLVVLMLEYIVNDDLFEAVLDDNGTADQDKSLEEQL